MSSTLRLAVRVWQLFTHYLKLAWLRYRSLGIRGKLVIWALLAFYAAVAFFLFVWPGGSIIGQALYDWAQVVSRLRFGWAVFVAAITVISFPPMIGHTTTLVLCGFAYGVKGFYLAAGASVFAAALVFVILRLAFRRRLRELSSKNEKWQALETVIRAKGLPLICLIRMSPLPPWVYSNALFASIEPVQLWQFVVAQIFVFPKIMIAIFVGSRAAALADGDQRGKMDKTTKILNIVLIIFTLSIGFATSWFIYREVRKHIRHLEGIPPEVDELAAEALEDGEDSPLLGNASSSSVDR